MSKNKQTSVEVQTEVEKERTTDREERGVGLGMKHRSMTIPDGLITAGHVGRIINDKPPGRIQSAMDSGWRFVENKNGARLGEGFEDNNSDVGSKISTIVDKSPRMGGEARGYLMEIKKEWYDADQVAKLKKTDLRDKAIRKGKSEATDNDNFYSEVKYDN